TTPGYTVMFDGCNSNVGICTCSYNFPRGIGTNDARIVAYPQSDTRPGGFGTYPAPCDGDATSGGDCLGLQSYNWNTNVAPYICARGSRDPDPSADTLMNPQPSCPIDPITG